MTQCRSWRISNSLQRTSLVNTVTVSLNAGAEIGDEGPNAVYLHLAVCTNRGIYLLKQGCSLKFKVSVVVFF